MNAHLIHRWRFKVRAQKSRFFYSILALMLLLIAASTASAAISLVQDATGTTTSTSVSATFPSPPTAGNLLVAIAANRNFSTAPDKPTGWSEAIVNTVSPGQVIYYRIAQPGNSSLVTAGPYPSSNILGLHIYEFSGIDPALPVDVVGQANGSGSPLSSGTAMTTAADALLLVGMIGLSSEDFSDWTNSFTELNDFDSPATGFAGAYRIVSSIDHYEAQATRSGNTAWRGQIVAFRAANPTISNVIIVDTVSDVLDGSAATIAELLADPGPDGVISLREAITAANGTRNAAGPDRILFDIPAPLIAGAHTIQPQSSLPAISDTLIIDGSSEPDFDTMPVIEIDGILAGGGNGFHLGANCDSSTIKGLTINRFGGHGIYILGSGEHNIAGNHIGTDVAGLVDRGNGGTGIYAVSSENTIGGLTSAARNIISGNGTYGIAILGSNSKDNSILGNYIGLNADGDGVIFNDDHAIEFSDAPGNTVGGTTADSRNVICAGVGEACVYAISGVAVGNVIRGNYMGTDASGTVVLGGGTYGVNVSTAPNTIVGGDMPGAGNLIAGYLQSGISGTGTGTVVQGNFIGTDSTGTQDLTNGMWGIILSNAAGNWTIGGATEGAGNIIANNSNQGIRLSSNAGTGIRINRNEIFANGALGIDINADGVTANDAGDGDGGPNLQQNFPVLAASETDGVANASVSGRLESASDSDYRIEFFASSTMDASGHGEGERYLGYTDVTTDAAGLAVFGLVLTDVVVALGEYVCATATDSDGNSSEFSRCIVATAPDQIYVTSTSDVQDGDTTFLTTLKVSPGPDGVISLREAITAANNTPNGADPDKILFDIPVADPGYDALEEFWSIQPSGTALPTIVEPIILDGYTQAGASPSSQAFPNALDAVLKLELNGTQLAGSGVSGLTLSTGNSKIRGLAINSFTGVSACGIHIQSGTGNTIQGNFLGTDVGSSLAMGNWFAGVKLDSPDNLMGGSVAGAGNLIANSTYGIYVTGDRNRIEGNLIGTNASGTLAMGNGNGIRLTGCIGTRIGGSDPGAGNLLSASSDAGLASSAVDSLTIQGNRIGTDITGSLSGALGNAGTAVLIESPNTIIGGTLAGEGNLISGNLEGIALFGAATNATVQGNLIGTDINGMGSLGNAGAGISVGTSGNLIGGTAPGAGNLIAHSGADNLIVTGGATNVSVIGNSIYDSGAAADDIGIDLNNDGVSTNDLLDDDSGPNDLLNYPVISWAREAGGVVTLGGVFDVPAGSYRFEFFKNPLGADPSGYGEGELFVAASTLAHTGSGGEPFGAAFLGAPGDIVTATLTEDLGSGTYGSSSEYSAAVTVTANQAPTDLVTIYTENGGLRINADGGNDSYLLANDGGAVVGDLTAITMEAQFTSAIAPQDGGDSDFVSYAAGAPGAGNNDLWFGVFRNDGLNGFELGLGMAGNYRYAPGYDASALYDGQHHTASVTWENAGGLYEFFVDGVSLGGGSGFRVGNVIPTVGEFVVCMEQDSIGGGFQSNQVFQGTLYDVRVFDDVRTGPEIAAGHGATLPANESGLLANWTCNDLAISGITTDTVAGNDLTVLHATGTGFIENNPELTLAVSEDALDGATIATIAAIDPDVGDWADFSLLDDAGGRFAIDGSSGQLRVANASLIDFSSDTFHDIIVQVADSGGLSYSELFTIEVLETSVATHVISGIIFEDVNFTGTAQSFDGGVNDLALANVDVELYDATDSYLMSAATDAGGNFTFTGLTDGDYKVRVRSATIGDADTPPAAGLNATVPATWPYPLPEMTWGHGAALIGGQDHNVDDTATGDNVGPGDTFVSVTINGASVSGVDLGFCYELIVNENDDLNPDDARSKQGSLRQFIKNANGIAGLNRSQFQIPGL